MKGQGSGKSDSEERGSGKFKWMDAIAKLLAALAVVFGAYIAKTYESKMSATTLLNQREQAESNLRATMFHDLIDPIIGKPGEGNIIDPDRERLLVELLTLNFHEHFEFKPLLVEVDKRLRGKACINSKNREKCEKGRASLWSVARRVWDRQVNMLRAEGEKANEKIGLVRVYFKYAGQSEMTTLKTECSWANPGREPENSPEKPALFRDFSEVVCLMSPDGAYRLELSMEKADFELREARVQVSVWGEGITQSRGVRANFPFTLTDFDFPLTDNTEIDGHHRFSVGLDRMDQKEMRVSLRLIWFPKGYITPRERPINYREIRKILDLGEES
jgi:hypothetical protein